MRTNKLSVNRLAMGNLHTHKKRYTVLIIGIILAMIFSSGSAFFISCRNSSELAIMHKKIGKQDAISYNVTKEQLNNLIDKKWVDPKVGYGHIVAYAFNPEKDSLKYSTSIAWLDDNAREYYCQSVIEGRYPEDAGEIAIEKTMLSRIDKTAKVGEKITLSTHTANGSEYMAETTEKTYTLVGILYDKFINIEEHNMDNENIYNIPAAFVCEKEAVELGGKECLISFCNFTKNSLGPNRYWKLYEVDMEMAVNSIKTFELGTLRSTSGEDVSSDITVAVMLSIMLTIGSCFVIVNSFTSNLNERKKQIGLLRAVGTTRRQIIKIFGREALIISLICAPISVFVSYFAVKLFAYLMGEYFIFVPNITVLLITTAVSVICVMLAALIPLIRISKISPMQAIRNTELMRKMKNKRIRSQKKFNASTLIAKRNMMFSRFRQVTVCFLLVLTMVISCLGISCAEANRNSKYGIRLDYYISLFFEGMYGNEFINYSDSKESFSESIKQEIAELPDVSEVWGNKYFDINMLVDGEYPDYLTLDDMDSLNKFELTYEDYERGYIPPEERKIADSYPETKKIAGYTGEFFGSKISAYDSTKIKELEKSVIDGKINIDKINSGEEVIVFAPKKVGYYYKKMSSRGWSSCLIDMSEKPVNGKYSGEYDEKYIRISAESCFKAGDEITLSTLVAKDWDSRGNATRYDRTVRIGAVINSDGVFDLYGGGDNYFSGVKFYTTTSGINTFGYQVGYHDLRVTLKNECTADIDEYMTEQLRGLVPNSNIASKFETNESREQEYRSTMIMLICTVILFTCICASLINNSVTAQIRESKRTIGTLRAVGTSMGDLTRCYSLQIFSMLGIGTAIGAVVYTVVHIIIRKYMDISYLPWTGMIVAAILFAVCFINLRLKIKKLTKDSVVDNIREL